jgi:hypothetical protein
MKYPMILPASPPIREFLTIREIFFENYQGFASIKMRQKRKISG